VRLGISEALSLSTLAGASTRLLFHTFLPDAKHEVAVSYSLVLLRDRFNLTSKVTGPSNVSADALSPTVERSAGHELMASPKDQTLSHNNLGAFLVPASSPTERPKLRIYFADYP